MPAKRGYLAATRHPWPCLLFLLPLLLTYEAGVLWLGGKEPETLRNGADTWLRWGLEALGLQQYYGAPLLVAVVLLVWSWRRRADRPEDMAGLCMGMGIESAIFAWGLWGLSRGLSPLLEHLGIHLSVAAQQEAVKHIVTFVGAGIYEEVLFRLLLYSSLIWLLRLVQIPTIAAVLFATITSALVFAAAHHVGSHGETFDGYAFVFRALAGVYFALLYQLRGFGIAVGTHASYDVLVGVLVQ